jgi:hypothetical protein
MVSEAAKGRESFDPVSSEPVVMSDGQRWYLPRPRLNLIPIFEGG